MHSHRSSLTLLSALAALLVSSAALAANYPLNIIQPQPDLDTTSRFYLAYPGLEYNVRLGVMGGLYPYEHQLLDAPAGMSINACTGEITWPAPEESDTDATVTVRIIDGEGSTAERTWTITVTTDGFLFLDAVNGTHAQGFGCTSDCGDGTRDNPFRSMGDFYRGDRDDNTYVGQFVYFRSGTYTYGDLPAESPGPWHRVVFPSNTKPNVWLAYPGDSPVIDQEHGPLMRIGGPNVFIDGLQVVNGNVFAFQMGGDDNVIRRCSFEDLIGGQDGSNSAVIMTPTTQSSDLHENTLIQDNRFESIGTACVNKWYTTGPLLIEDNQVYGSGDNAGEGIALKSDVRRATIRNNRFYDAQRHVIGGNMHSAAVDSGEFEIHHNLLLGGYPGGDSVNDLAGAINLNQDRQVGPIFLYRNTIEGRVRIQGSEPGNGPFEMYANVFVTDDYQINDTPSGSGVTLANGADPNLLVLGEDPEHNLAGNAGSGIIDETGALTEAHADYLYTHGYQQPDTCGSVGGGGTGAGGAAGGADQGGADQGGASHQGGGGANALDGSDPDADGGCGCRTAGGDRPDPAAPLSLLLGLGLLLRRRR